MGLKQWLFGPPNKDRFAAILIEAFRKAGDPRKYEYDKEQFLIKAAEGFEINLTNIYIEHCQTSRGDRKNHIQQIVTTFMNAEEELPESFEDAKPNLRPKIWARSMFADMALASQLKDSKEIDSPNYPLGEHLVAAVVYDTPTAIRSLAKEDLEKWGVSYYEAMEIATANLEEATSGKAQIAQIGDGFYSSITGDAYDTARILFQDKIRSWEVKGDHVAMLPQRDALYVTGSDDEVGLKIMVDLATITLKENLRPLSPIPLRLVDGEWVDWEFPKSHPEYAKYHILENEFFAGIYGSQKALLDEIHEKDGTDIFVANFSCFIHKASQTEWSYCVWSKDCDSMIPKTDLIMMHSGSDPFPCLWEEVAKIAGHLLEPVADLYPIRYRTTSFPNDEQLAKIVKFDI